MRRACIASQVVAYERPALSKAYLFPESTCLDAFHLMHAAAPSPAVTPYGPPKTVMTIAAEPARLPGFHTTVGGGGEKQLPEWYEEKGEAAASTLFFTGMLCMCILSSQSPALSHRSWTVQMVC